METAKIEPTVEAEKTVVDYKMVTFTLAGKDYAIDIMKVKEISKTSRFTFVPNAAPFVRGVYNLRGDIISVIDLRQFFNLLVESEEIEESSSMIVLRLQDHHIAVIVDRIDKVVGISSQTIQPPHPLFGDINIQYISGVVENEGHLYVILDVESIFGSDEKADEPPAPEPAPVEESLAPAAAKTVKPSRDEVDVGFIEETLPTFVGFYPTEVNRAWIRERFKSWKADHGDDLQLSGEADAWTFLETFSSPYSGHLWGGDYRDSVASLLPETWEGNFFAWNPGCGGGEETYSLACLLKDRYPDAHLRLYGNDRDLIRISAAPGLVMEPGSHDPWYDRFLVDGAHGRQFDGLIKDAVIFEYHDVTHDNTLPKLDLVVIRDTISFLPPEGQSYVFRSLEDSIKPGGLLVLGTHEVPMRADSWDVVENRRVVAYKKR